MRSRRSWLSGALLGALLCTLAVAPAMAERVTTRDAFDRLEEVLESRQDDGILDKRDVLPTILVSARPMYQGSERWFGVRALQALTRVFGRSGIRACEACMQPRAEVEDGRMVYTSGPIAIDEISRLDERYRGDANGARTATWIDETATGVAVRIVDLRSAQVVFAQNIDPMLYEARRTATGSRMSQELERRHRGESLTHAMFDFAMYPGQHASLEWADQWGVTNRNLSGFVLSLYDPVLGVGAGYHRVLGFWDTSIGAKVMLSIPTAIVSSQIDEDVEILDPLVTGVFVMRVPLWGSNYAALLSASTNGQVGIGVSMLNTTFLPFLP